MDKPVDHSSDPDGRPNLAARQTEHTPVLEYASAKAPYAEKNDLWPLALACLLGGMTFCAPGAPQALSFMAAYQILRDPGSTPGQRVVAALGITCALLSTIFWVVMLVSHFRK